jgi:hypothetical protein
MSLLRKVLILEAAALAIAGVGMLIAPKFLTNTVFNMVLLPEYAWVRLGGVAAITLAMYCVLMARKIEELWWWAWGMVLGTGVVAILCLAKAALGIGSGSPRVFWGVLGLGALLFALGLMWGIARASSETPPPEA